MLIGNLERKTKERVKKEKKKKQIRKSNWNCHVSTFYLFVTRYISGTDHIGNALEFH